jgi:hypothetical protein
MVGFIQSVGDIFSGGAEGRAADRDRAAAQLYQGQANTALQNAYGTGTTAINQGVQSFAPLAQLGQTLSSGAPAYMSAIGAGTPAQTAQAQAAFQQTPGYKSLMDSALQAVQRQEAAGGMGASGNADIKALLASTGVTSNAYQQYIDNLLKGTTLGANVTGAAATGQAGQYDTLANLAKGYGEDVSGVAGNVMNTNVGASNLQGAGEAAGAKNLLGAGLSLATLGMGGNPFGGSLTGGGGSGGGFGSSLLGSIFGGGGSNQVGSVGVGNYQMPTIGYNPYKIG